MKVEKSKENSNSSSSDDIFDFMDGDATKAIKRNRKKEIPKIEEANVNDTSLRSGNSGKSMRTRSRNRK